MADRSELMEAYLKVLRAQGRDTSKIDKGVLRTVMEKQLLNWNHRGIDPIVGGRVNPTFFNLVEQDYIQVFKSGQEANYGTTPQDEGGGGNDGGGDGTDAGGYNIPGYGNDGGGDTGLTEHEKEVKARRREQQNFNQEQAFIASLAGYGIRLTSNLQALVTEGQRKNWTAATFLNYLRKTPEYAQRFPGIMTKGGVLKMSESQYIRQEGQYQDIAAEAGINLGPQKMADLFRGNTSVGEFRTKAPAISRLRTDPQLQRQLEQVVGHKLSKQEVLKFVIGEGNSEWYNDWNRTIARNAAVDAGITFKGDGYTKLKAGMVEKYGLQGLTEEQLATGFEEIADSLLSTLPEAQIQSMGLSKKDIVAAHLGGKGSAKARALIKRVTATTEAYSDEERGDSDILSASTKNRYGGQGA